MGETPQPTHTVTVHRDVSERPVSGRYTPSAGASVRRRVPLEHTLRDQVRNLGMAISDLKIQVSDLAAALARD